MRNFVSILMTCILTSGSIMASCGSWCDSLYDSLFPCNSCCCDDWPSAFYFDAGVGFREDHLKWSIAGPRNRPKVLSELKWDDLKMTQVEAAATYTSWRNYAVRLAADYGWIYNGRNTDKDFIDRDDESDFPEHHHKDRVFSLSKNNAGEGYVYDIDAAAGYRFTSTCGRLIGTLLAGYAWNSQHLRIFDGKQLIDTISCQLGTIQGLNSRYTADWYGPWIGLDFIAKVECCAYIFGGFEWHQLTYRGVGCWNLRTDIGQFRHKAYGQGYTAVLGLNWELWCHWSIGIVGRYRNYRASSGSESLPLIHGPDCVEVVHTRFNGAKWESASISGIIAWRF